MEGHCRQTSLACAGALQCLGRAGFAPTRACVLSPSTLLRLQVALPELSEAGPGLRALPRPKRLRVRFSTKAQTWLGLRLCPAQVPSSGDLLLGGRRRGRPQLGQRLIASPVPAAGFSGCTVGAPSQVFRVSPLAS